MRTILLPIFFVLALTCVADGAPLSLLASKLSIRGTLGEADLHDVKMASEACHASEDYAEGRKAFIEKRKPNFRGR